MTKHYPDEFKADVVAMALRGEVPKRRIACECGDLRDDAVSVDQPVRRRSAGQ